MFWSYWNRENAEDMPADAVIPPPRIGKFRHFEHLEPTLDAVEARFGRASFIGNWPGGIAMWSTADLQRFAAAKDDSGRMDPRGIFHTIMLMDEYILHCDPKPHHDFLYATVKMKIPSNKLGEILSVSKSIMYDRLKQEVTIRCGAMGPIIATLYVILRKSIGKIPRKPYGYYVMISANPGVLAEMLGDVRDLWLDNQKLNAPAEHCVVPWSN